MSHSTGLSSKKPQSRIRARSRRNPSQENGDISHRAGLKDLHNHEIQKDDDSTHRVADISTKVSYYPSDDAKTDHKVKPLPLIEPMPSDETNGTPYTAQSSRDHYFFHDLNTSSQLRQAQRREEEEGSKCWNRFKRRYQSMYWHQILRAALCGARRPCRTLIAISILTAILAALFTQRTVIQDSINYTRPMPGVELAKKGFRAHNPIVLIPGIVSTGLELWQGLECAQNNFRKRMWGSTMMLQAILLNSRCWLQHLKLNQTTGLDPEGIRLRAAEGLEAADYLLPGFWIWARLIEDAAAIGYDTNNLHMVAYDWRLDYFALEERDGYFTKLKTKIELTKRLNRNRKIVLVAHSMGVLVVQYFFSWVESPLGGNGGTSWVEDHIDSFVMVGAPHLGVPKAVSALVSGEMRDTAEMATWMAYIRRQALLSNLDMAGMLRAFRSIPSMLPKGGSVIWGEVGKQAPDDDALLLCKNRYQGVFQAAEARAREQARQRGQEEQDFFDIVLGESKDAFDSLAKLAAKHIPKFLPNLNFSTDSVVKARNSDHDAYKGERDSLADRIELMKLKFSDYANQAIEMFRAAQQGKSNSSNNEARMNDGVASKGEVHSVSTSLAARISSLISPYADASGEVSPSMPGNSLAAIYRSIVEEEVKLPSNMRMASNMLVVMPEASETLIPDAVADYVQMKRDTKRRIRSALRLLFRHNRKQCIYELAKRQDLADEMVPFELEKCGSQVAVPAKMEDVLYLPDKQLEKLIDQALPLVKQHAENRLQSRTQSHMSKKPTLGVKVINTAKLYESARAEEQQERLAAELEWFDALRRRELRTYRKDNESDYFEELYQQEIEEFDETYWDVDEDGDLLDLQGLKPSEVAHYRSYSKDLRSRVLGMTSSWASQVQAFCSPYRDLPFIGYPIGVFADAWSYQGFFTKVTEAFASTGVQAFEWSGYLCKSLQSKLQNAYETTFKTGCDIVGKGSSSTSEGESQPQSERCINGESAGETNDVQGKPLGNEAAPSGGLATPESASLRGHIPHLTGDSPSTTVPTPSESLKESSTIPFVPLEDENGFRRTLGNFTGAEIKSILTNSAEEKRQEQARSRYDAMLRREASAAMLEESLPRSIPRRVIKGDLNALSGEGSGIRADNSQFNFGVSHTLESGGGYNATGLLDLLQVLSPAYMTRMKSLYEFDAIPREQIVKMSKLSQSKGYIEDMVEKAACSASDDLHLVSFCRNRKMNSTTPNCNNTSSCHQAVMFSNEKVEEGLLNTTYIFDVYKRQALIEAQKNWANPLAVPLPKAPSVKFYAIYGVGKPAERGYVYRLNPDRAERRYLPYVIDARVADPDIHVRRGVRVTDGDGTVPLISLGYMCAKGGGWDAEKHPHLNPSGIKCVVREFTNKVSPMEMLRISADSADHVDIIGNTEMIADVLKIAGRFGPDARSRVEQERIRNERRQRLLESRVSKPKESDSIDANETAFHQRPRCTTVSGSANSREQLLETEKYETIPDEEGKIELLSRVLSCIDAIARRVQLP